MLPARLFFPLLGTLLVPVAIGSPPEDAKRNRAEMEGSVHLY